MGYHAVVMAAQRVGIVNELAADAGVSHKCLIEMGGKRLLEHVLDCLDHSPEIKQITVSIDDLHVLENVPAFRRLKETGKARAVQSATDLFSSFLKAVEGTDRFPALVTTADNVLLTPAMVGHFCADIERQKARAAVALTEKAVLLNVYPDGQRRFHKFADNEYSNCNLYAIVDKETSNLASVFQTGGQFAKSLARVLKAFGIWNAIAYRFSLYSLDKGMERLSKKFKTRLVAVRMPFPEAPIDVDNFRSKKLATEILAARQQAA